MTLQECNLWDQVKVDTIRECDMKRRLLDLGFVHGVEVIPVLDSPSKGMRAYQMKGCKIALRDSESACIYIEKGERDAL